ncbi:hypothetical protein FA95DRAFT_635956 [Auriscalpium vulgare]|uniref:Uncharacterized protein n=1 Tax=Auriscalpium vulgare TaxID=40419 RepID=A0ACB8RD71_9AGAM|nr:hypothetical protein FA95DRAFT_635956 [Auriscalpium vulgare]
MMGAALLDKLVFNPAKDTLIHLGDVSAKGTESGSISVLSFMTKNNITGVRGNHDQKVLEWRAWVDWIKSLGKGTGALWLDDVDMQWEAARKDPMIDEEEWVIAQKKSNEGEETWWDRVPDGWQMFSEHYHIARSITKAETLAVRSFARNIKSAPTPCSFTYGFPTPWRV